MGGSCGSASEGAVGTGNIPITLTQPDNATALTAGSYSDCTLTVDDGLGNTSNVLALTAFVIDISAPTVNTNAGITLDEGSNSNIVSSVQLSSTDNLSGAANVVYTLVSTTNNGALRKSGAVLTGGATFTQSDINNNFITYDHNGSETTSDTFMFTVRDQVSNVNNNAAANFTFNLMITPQNDDGVVSISGGSAATQGQPLTANISDGDGTTTSSFSYLWKRGIVDVGTAQIYVPVQADVGSTVTVTVSYRDDSGNEEDVSSATAIISNANDLGVATIDGTPEEDQTLTANISDGDGTPTNISYQWKRNGINITPGGTAETYVPVQVDVGKDLTVVVSYSDPFGATSATSSAVNILNLNDIGIATITGSGTATQGQPLTANIIDADGAATGISYQWKRGGTVDVGTAQTYVPVQADVNEELTVVISYSDPYGSDSATSAPTVPVANINDQGVVIISGIPTEGQTLMANITDLDGTTPNTFTYQWKRDDVVITGATLETYDLVQDDVNKTITVSVIYTDNLAGMENVTSNATASINNINDAGVAVINGTATKGETLSVDITDADGLPGTVNYQWKRNDVDIPLATGSAYILVQADVGGTITVTVSYIDILTTPENITSNPTVIVADVNNTGVATITGTPTENQTLTVNITDADGLASSIFSYQWMRDGADIAGATANTYALSQADVDSAMTVTVNYSDDLGNAESVISTATVPIENENDVGIASIDGAVEIGTILTASVTDTDGTTTSTLMYQWKRAGVAIADATNVAYTLQPADNGNAITVTVSYTDDQGTPEIVTSSPTTSAEDKTPPVITLPTVDPVVVDAEGLFTSVDFGVATAEDNIDGVLTPTSNAPNKFEPGTTDVVWSATDAAGNTATATQVVTVRPLVDFSVDKVVAENSSDTIVSFRIFLNGKVDYAVDVPYIVNVNSTAMGGGIDHNLDLMSGTATIDIDSEFAEVSFTVFADADVEGLENITIDMGTPTPNATVGMKSSLSIDITEDNVAPLVSLSAVQDTVSTRTITLARGDVSVSSDVIDLNDDALIYDWSATDNALIDNDGNVNNAAFVFDPSGLSPGFYTLRLSVSDGNATTEAELLLNILTDALVSTIADVDNDGIPDLLDLSEKTNIFPTQSGLYTSGLLETQAGLKFSLGDISFQTGKGQANVSLADISNAGKPADTGFAYASGLSDFNITGLGIAGQSINIVIPQKIAIPANATYRKLMVNNWQEFVVDANNAIASAPGTPGFCSPPGDAQYQPGLTQGHLCVQLTIEDGGANDADGAANNKISDPSGVATVFTAPKPPGTDDSNGIFGLGSLSLWWLSLFGLFGLRNLYARVE